MSRRTGSDRDAPAASDTTAIPALARLKRRPEFLAVAAARRRWAAPGLVLQARRRAAESAPVPDATIRYGITASRKVGNAVARNRAKRRLRAAAVEILPGAAAPGYDVVLIARAATVDRPFAALKADLAQGLAKLMPPRPADTTTDKATELES